VVSSSSGSVAGCIFMFVWAACDMQTCLPFF
jgi:hypothetical protein